MPPAVETLSKMATSSPLATVPMSPRPSPHKNSVANLSGTAGDTPHLQYASYMRVCSRITLYYATLVDLRWQRSVHTCNACAFTHPVDIESGLPTTEGEPFLCRSVHYGQCTAVNRRSAAALAANRVQRAIMRDKSNWAIKGSHMDRAILGKGGQNEAGTRVGMAGSVRDELQERRRVTKRVVTRKNLQLQLEQQSQKYLDVNHPHSPVSSHVDKSGDSLSLRGDPDGLSDTFLRQKEAQLKDRREKERKDKLSDPPQALGSVGTQQTGSNQYLVGKKDSGDSKDANKQAGASLQTNQSASEHSSQSKTGARKLLHDHHGDNETNLSASRPSNTGGVASAKSVTSSARHSQSDHVLGYGHHGKVNQVHIPQFYFPLGRNVEGQSFEAVNQKVKDAFAQLDATGVDKKSMANIAKAIGLPCYLKVPLFLYCGGGDKHETVSLNQILSACKKLCDGCHDNNARFLRLLAKPGRHWLDEDDFIPLVTDVVESHPGLTFLKDAPEFHSRYIQTVISRIFYTVNRSWTGRITLKELRRSNLLQTIKMLEDEEDINQITDYFSYEHFYVIYCKFWELDKDHDLFISREDMARHNEHAISSKMINRIFTGTVTRNLKDGKYMSYKDFVWFLMSEEDKQNPTSVEYWFRCMDLDGDGVISMYEMEYFYQEQVEKMEQLGIETLPFEDTLCQMLDMIKTRVPGSITLGDLKACKLSPIFFDTFFNLDKYLEHEQKDPFANQRDIDSDEPEPSDWEKYAAEEYELLVAEEGANEELVYEDDFEPDEEMASTTAKNSAAAIHKQAVADNNQSKQSKQTRPRAPSPEDDIYDFSTQNLGY